MVKTLGCFDATGKKNRLSACGGSDLSPGTPQSYRPGHLHPGTYWLLIIQFGEEKLAIFELAGGTINIWYISCFVTVLTGVKTFSKSHLKNIIPLWTYLRRQYFWFHVFLPKSLIFNLPGVSKLVNANTTWPKVYLICSLLPATALLFCCRLVWGFYTCSICQLQG